MAFELALWSDGAIHMLVVCEEAHRYIPADPNLGFVPTRQAIARIAKEGRKYGVSLGIITQRPGELDQTILSQCSTLFAMRLSNDRDQEIIRSAIPNSSISTTSFLSSIGNGEAIAFGEAIAVPMRMRFTRVEENLLAEGQRRWSSKASEETPDTVDLRNIVSRMRSVVRPRHLRLPAELCRGSSRRQCRRSSADASNPADGGHETQPARPFADAQPAIEPYRPDMLPRVASAGTCARQSAADFDRQQACRTSPEPAARRCRTGSRPAPVRRSQLRRCAASPALSLRDSILKKPLSSLYNKD